MDAKKLLGAIESAGYEARSYSGRGMFGKECVGVEIPQDESAFALAAKLVLAVFDEDGDEEAYNFTSDLADLCVSEDAMGPRRDRVLSARHVARGVRLRGRGLGMPGVLHAGVGRVKFDRGGASQHGFDLHGEPASAAHACQRRFTPTRSRAHRRLRRHALRPHHGRNDQAASPSQRRDWPWPTGGASSARWQTRHSGSHCRPRFRRGGAPSRRRGDPLRNWRALARRSRRTQDHDRCRRTRRRSRGVRRGTRPAIGRSAPATPRRPSRSVKGRGCRFAGLGATRRPAHRSL